MPPDFSIRPERPQDIPAIADVHKQAFGPDEPIPELVERLRVLNAPLSTISLVATDPQGAVQGHVMLSHAWLDAPDRMIDILVLSPLGVASNTQKMGIGTGLIHQAIEVARGTTAPILILEGNPKFYGPRGFEPAKGSGIRSPSLRIPEAALQVVRLPNHRPEISGSLVYRDLWWELDCVGLR